MGLNSYKPHILIIPEDPRLHDVCVGFEKRVGLFANGNAIRVDPEAGGRDPLWNKVKDEEVAKLRIFQTRHLVIVRDFDGDAETGRKLLEEIDPEIRRRVFVVGPLDEVEDLRAEIREGGNNTLEAIGETVHQNCSDSDSDWNAGIAQLEHLTSELGRLRVECGDILGLNPLD